MLKSELDKMELREGIWLDINKSFGKVTFSALAGTVRERDEDTQEFTGNIIARRYDLISSGQRDIIRVRIPESAGEKTFNYGDEVELVNVSVGTLPHYDVNSGRRNVEWFLQADDIVAKGQAHRSVVSNNKSDDDKAATNK